MLHKKSPLILAPAGNKESFLAALAAGADAVYCGLKKFSARMGAKNFSVRDLVSLTELAHDKGTEVYIAVNSLMKPDETDMAGKLLDQLNRWIKPDALIIQDLGMLQLARQTGFSGRVHLSTLAGVNFPTAIKLIQERLKPEIARVVLPRELGIDEIKTMAQACVHGPELEVFIHGALCYGVSGRCYWSSYMGGKSGLRGRCVQPCRRFYTQKASERKRFFSCQDLHLDVLARTLLPIPEIRAWKIEGRKKGPHYVFYTVTAYKLLRDHGSDPGVKKQAMQLLNQALGRPGTHYYFLPQRPWNPVSTKNQTGSGLMAGIVKGPKKSPYIIPFISLLPGDTLRIGYEDESWHHIQHVRKYIPKKGRLNLKPSSGNIPPQTPVFLTDRREKALDDLLTDIEGQRADIPVPQIAPSDFRVRAPGIKKKRNPLPRSPQRKGAGRTSVHVIEVRRTVPGNTKNRLGIWLSLSASHFSLLASHFFWLPPVIWPEQEKDWKDLITLALKKRYRNFVLNAPWQIEFFPGYEKELNLWAGPFCNLSNSLALREIADMGFSGAILSPELGSRDYLKLPGQSPLPLGIVISGHWPLCISRIPPELKPDIPFTSPRGEDAWFRKYDSNIWVWPNWKLDIEEKKAQLVKAGYRMFVRLVEPLPKDVTLKKRPGIWNWDIKLL